MEAVAGVIALVFLLLVAAGTVAAVRTVRAVRRGVERTGAQARRMVEETTLRARRAQPGAAGEVAALRLRLRTSVVATREALESGASADPSLKEALGLLERLRHHAHALDDELRTLEREPDRARLAARLPELRERTSRLTHSADSLRWAAQDRARRHADDDLTALGRQIEVEAAALRHWLPAEPEDRARLDRT
ncbi:MULTISPECIES: MerR family transcriptional regulator [Streptomycetaceae]|uniref:Secreted protein n=1 Tax=Streptantibioticus cattleyicolor (strain ATCC 35852 / DSM 46488 / JCM 4925 / NBRC 14057 / NRRL 8057) TaxID=1003195 RepID=F8JP35_STREN